MSDLPESEQKQEILVVDDEIEIIKSLRRQFMRYYHVNIANSGQEALEILKNKPIKVIISDQRMPDMNGSEFLSHVEKHYPDSIRMLLTGFADINAVIQAVNEGHIFRYVTKPWNPIELDSIVGEAFERYNIIEKNRDLLEQLQSANATLEERVRQRTIELEKANEKLNQIATHDHLTGLANRALFQEQLDLCLASAKRNKKLVAVFFLDLDGFKAVNDTYGHDIGDKLLQQVSTRIKNLIRAEDVLARIGGDEFSLLTSNLVDKADVKRISHAIIHAISEIFELDGHQCKIGVSIGISFYPEHAEDATSLLKKADEAMYAIKKSGKNNYLIYDD
ncbi:hypothetical protein NBRC116592_24430 [Colwellia sp. KU-HH00111]|uniref:two-component system response regulator n=1 Tax=Colwellia sp. KU-HH00111 TaxID=3127652 RepID=UPI00310637D9